MKSKKKAFTLTELLVVFIVIGVLSAAVLPKFSKVIETRKTTEAEELMSSIRTEQEKRCALDKPYLTDLSQMSDIIKTASTKNYQISLQGKGIEAASVGSYNYTLQMPSYTDGRICCDGADCAKLNKNYPSCTGFKYEESPDSCAGTVTPVEPPAPCTDCSCAEYAAAHPAQCNPTPTCDDSKKPSDNGQKITCGGNTCGFQTVSYFCDASTNYEWQRKLEGTCVPEPPAESPCPAGAVGVNIVDDWACMDGEWVDMAGSSTCTCDPATKPQAESKKCNLCGEQVRETRCDWHTYSWVIDGDFSACSVASEDDCDKCALDPTPQNCCDEDEQRLVDGSAQTNRPLMIFDAKARKCVCPAGTTRQTNEYGFPECFCTNVAANKAQCCPAEPYSNTTCYKFAGGVWKMQSQTSEVSQGGSPAYSTCNIQAEISSSDSVTWECSEDDDICNTSTGSYCNGGHAANGGAECPDEIKTVWKCSKSYARNGW